MRKPISVWKSKKGGIPAINEILMTFLNITPKPILFAIFLVLITTIAGVVIPTVLNIFGYSCIERVGSMELYQVPMSSLLQKTVLDINRGLGTFFGDVDYQLPDDPFPNGDKTRLRIPNECFITSNVNGSNVYGYVSACVDCQTNANWFQGFFTPKDQLICTGDGFYQANYGVAYRTLCSICNPPNPYYFNYTNCITEDGCYFTITDPSLVPIVVSDYVNDVDYQKILELGGVLRPQDNTEMINLQCNQNKLPSLFFFSVEIFNKTLWVLLFVGYAVVLFSLAWYKVVL